jgi:hypothetical protein
MVTLGCYAKLSSLPIKKGVRGLYSLGIKSQDVSFDDEDELLLVMYYYSSSGSTEWLHAVLTILVGYAQG